MKLIGRKGKRSKVPLLINVPNWLQRERRLPPSLLINKLQQHSKKNENEASAKATSNPTTQPKLAAAKASTKANGEKVEAKAKDAEIEQLQATIAQLRENLAEKDKEIVSKKDILTTIGLSAIDQFRNENDALKEQLKNSMPIETVDLTNANEVQQSSGDDLNEGEPPSQAPKKQSCHHSGAKSTNGEGKRRSNRES